MKNRQGNTFWQIWGMPLLLAVLTIFGLVAALVGTGIWHGLAWIAIAVPVGVCLHFGWWKRRTNPSQYSAR
ncbi:MAG TPA: hypothetical protein VF050_07105 [Moraxellaceae bacterium]